MSDLAERLAGLSPAKRQLLEQRLKAAMPAAEPIAIVGMACRFPGAPDLDAYWRLIRDGVDATGEIPSTRWDVEALFDPTGQQPGKMSVRWAGMLDGIDQFDPQFFGISPREASRMDPQQRLLLEVAWESLEVAGLSPSRLGGTRTGVFVGIGGTDYSKIPSQFEDYYQHIDAHVGTGNALSIAANRVSYILDLRGPSIAIDTACSSGLIGIHVAVQSLRNRECDAALAGGVNVIVSPETTIAFSKARMLSPDGCCRPFDAEANGYVRGEGCALVVLKRLTEAIADGDNVLAVIRATAANQDGRTSGITAPSGPAQQAVIRAALAQAGLSPDQVGYVEAHGTGTPLGDPIEIEALAKVFRRSGTDTSPCYVSSVKANIGHTETVSGVAGLIKVVLMMQHGVIPPQLHLKTLNPRLSLEGTRLRVPDHAVDWHSSEAPRVAGVSSFGFGGTNAHVLVEEASPPAAPPRAADDRPVHLLALSAKTPGALSELARRYARWLQQNPQADVADIGFTANTGRQHFHHRAAVVSRNAAELGDRLQALVAGRTSPGTKWSRVRSVQNPKVAFLFTGQGSQYTGMGQVLFQTQPTFRKTLKQCDEVLRDCLGQPLLDVLFDGQGAGRLLDETAYTQPALFALEYSLARLWQTWGIEPSAVMGHSVGEYVAACVAGVFSLEDGLRLIAMRARLMDQLPRDGLMAVVFAAADHVQEKLETHRGQVSVAAVNGPENTVISGAAAGVRALVEQFAAEGVTTQLLTVSHAFHSPLMEPILDDFQTAAQRFACQSPKIPLVSNLTGGLIGDQRLDAEYWRRHIRSTVRFSQGMNVLAQQGCQAMLEVGPTASLLGMGRRCLPELDVRWLPSLRKGQQEWQVMLDSLSELYLLGANVDGQGFDRDYPRRKTILPTYPFQRERYWFDSSQSAPRSMSGGRGPRLHPLLGSRVPAALSTRLFEAGVSCHSPPYLKDHQIQGSPVFPAAGYAELALAAADQVFGQGPHVLENLSIQHAMFLAEEVTRTVQTTVSAESGGRCSLEIFSGAADDDPGADSWTVHACGDVRHRDTVPDPEPSPIDREEVLRRVEDVMAHQQFYQELMLDRGLAYGPAFQVIWDLYRTKTEVFCEIRLSPEVAGELDQYQLHPVLGDALLQSTAGVVPLEPDGSYSPHTYMPTTVGRLRMLKRPSGKMYAYAVRRSAGDQPSPESVEVDVSLLDESGQVLVEVTGVRLQRVGGAQHGRLESDLRPWLYRVAWQSSLAGDGEPAVAPEPASRAGTWLLLADRSGVADALAARLRQAGCRCVMVRPADDPQRNGANQDAVGDTYRIDPLDPDAYRRVFAEALGSDATRCDGVVHLWSLDAGRPEDTGAAALADARRLGCGSALQLIGQLGRFRWDKPPALWLVTRGAQDVTAEQAQLAVAQSPLWGLGRVAAVEIPELAIRLVDLDGSESSVMMAVQLEHELAGSDGENQLAYRGGQRLVARLQRAPELLPEDPPAQEAITENGVAIRVPPSTPFRMRLGTPGSLDSLRLESAPRKRPAEGQVEVRVRAAGLNFSDVLKAMGLYPGLTDPIVPLGIECSGVVTAVGEGVTRFQPGDPVMGVAPFSFASHALSAEFALVPRPPSLTDAEAATIPITFLTAYYGLVHLAHLQAGERVLIHAAAGGVGLAAIQIAQHIGAEVFATAGSDQKRQFLRGLGVRHVFSSRTMEFADQILEGTARQGVDVVLNSLPGEAMTRSLAVLRAYGRFLEIGKTDIYQNRRVGLLPFQNNLSYFAIDLDRMLRQRPDYIRGLFAEVMEGFANGVYQPLARTEFPIEQTVDAFRYMAQRKNIGKIVVSLEDGGRDAAVGGSRFAERLPGAPQDRGPAGVRPDGTYLVTGGLGALGLQIADWLAAQGARYLALLARGRPSQSAAAVIDGLRSRGVEAAVLQGDVSDPDALAAAIGRIPDRFPPLRGVIHAAGVLDDGLLLEMSLEQLDRPMAPKVLGAWNLHQATQGATLDFFILFSSVASILGSPGQANYAAGNAFLDALAAWRRRQGLPALSINWGPWAGSGMAAGGNLAAQMESRGMAALPPDRALSLLARTLRSDTTNFVAMQARWPDMLRRMSGRVPPLLAEMAPKESDQAAAAADDVDRPFRNALLGMDVPRRVERLREYFAQELSRIMGLDPGELDVAVPLNQIGMDSLLAMELKSNLERRLAFQIPMAAFLEGPSVTSLAEHAAQALAAAGGQAALRAPGAVPGGDMASWSPLVSLQSAGGGPPLFCIHPLGGDVNCYRELARQIQDRPVYGLRGRGSEGRFPPHPTMTEMMHAYVQSMREVQPSGPYYLIGWSAGGVLAYELARTFCQLGHGVGLLMLLDTPLPSIYDHVSLDDDAKFLFDLGNFANWFAGSDIDVQNLSYKHLQAMDEQTRWEFALQIAKTHGVLPPDTSTEHIRRVVEAAKAHATMIRSYTIKPLEQTVHLVRPDRSEVLSQMTGQMLGPDLGWGEVLGDRLRIHHSPGDHFSMLRGDPAACLAQRVAECLERVATSAGSARKGVRS